MTHNLSCELAELRQELAELRKAFDSLKSDYLATAGVLHDVRGDFRMHEAVVIQTFKDIEKRHDHENTMAMERSEY